MPARPSYKIDRRLLERDFTLSAPVFKKEADAIIRKDVFLPAVEKLQQDFEEHLVTQEISEGPLAENISNTLIGSFTDPNGNTPDETPPNLYTFIGFERDEGDPLEPIRTRLDPNHASGPKMIYKGKESDRLTFTYEIRAPNESAILNETPMPWAKGSISWAKRIEQGIPGIGHYLNVLRKKSRSGGAIQVEGELPGRIRYRPVSYLSGLFRDFLARVGRK